MAGDLGRGPVGGRFLGSGDACGEDPAFFFLSFCLLRAAPVAYGGSQTRGVIRAAAAGLHHSSWQHQILNPLSGARD